jgi:hypothetical protein
VLPSLVSNKNYAKHVAPLKMPLISIIMKELVLMNKNASFEDSRKVKTKHSASHHKHNDP